MKHTPNFQKMKFTKEKIKKEKGFEHTSNTSEIKRGEENCMVEPISINWFCLLFMSSQIIANGIFYCCCYCCHYYFDKQIMRDRDLN